MKGIVSTLGSSLENFIYTPYFRIGFLIFSIFFLLIMIGLVRKRYFHFTMEGANFGFVLGVITILLLETIAAAAVLYGHHTFDIVKGERKPKEVVELTREGLEKVNRVLGVQLCPQITPSATFILEQFPNLTKSEEEKVKQILCR